MVSVPVHVPALHPIFLLSDLTSTHVPQETLSNRLHIGTNAQHQRPRHQAQHRHRKAHGHRQGRLHRINNYWPCRPPCSSRLRQSIGAHGTSPWIIARSATLAHASTCTKTSTTSSPSFSPHACRKLLLATTSTSLPMKGHKAHTELVTG